MVRISFCDWPLSPIALRAALMRLSVSESETIAAAPDRSDKVVPADDTVAIFEQVDQDVKHLRLDGHSPAVMTQFASIRIKYMI